MNILYIHTHDSGRYFEPYGYPLRSPRIMQLAREGVLFRQAFSAAPTCSPSRAALLTGMSPHSCGMLGLAHRGFSLMDYSWHIVYQLNSIGYETVLSGIQHVASHNEGVGYTRILGNSSYDMSRSFDFDTVEYDTYNACRVADYIRDRKPGDRPFFLSFGMFNTHRLFPPVHKDIDPDYIRPPFPLQDTRENREDFAGYLTSARIVDSCVGTVMDALMESGMKEQTIVIFTTDHGIPFPEMKCTLYDTGIGVTLILRYPANPMAGHVCDALVSHVDLYPTLCDLIGTEKPGRLQGLSLLPLMEGKKDSVREEVFSEVTYHAAYEPMRCIRTARYKLIKRFDDNLDVIPANMDDCSGKDFLVNSGYLNAQHHREALFDLYLDPLERINRIGCSDYRRIYSDLNRRLMSWMERTDDPLFRGRVGKPEGAFANRQDCLSPGDDLFE
ncbi:MAG TPA: sulfatase [Spirochaetia bacterium]|nr:sulfatase [Spirochaetia bacterium]